jgi:hypothetical protein
MIRTRQPQGAVRVDWANPITKGLRRAIIPTSGWYGTDVVGNASYSAFYGGSTPAKIAPDSIGLCFLQHRALYNQCLQVATWTNVTSEASLLIIRRGAGTILCQASTAKDEFPFSGLAYCQSFWTSRWMSGVAAPSGNSFSGANTIIHSVKNGSQKSFWNGIEWHSSTATGGFSLPATVSFGCDASGETNGQCNIALALLFDRALSSAEATSLSLNPWQIFAPSRRVWVQGADVAPEASSGVYIQAPKRTRQPQGAVRPHVPAVAVGLPGLLTSDLVCGVSSTTPSGTFGVDGNGTFVSSPRRTHQVTQALSSEYTLIAVVSGGGNNGDNYIGADGATRYWQMQRLNPGAVSFIPFNTSNGTASANCYSSAVSPIDCYVCIGTIRAGYSSAFAGPIGGVSGSMTLGPTAISPVRELPAGGTFWISARDSGWNNNYAGKLYGYAILPYGIGLAEANEIIRAPWDYLFGPSRRVVYFGAGGSGGGNITFTADPYSLAFTGSTASLFAGRKLASNPASLTLSGAVATPKAARQVIANPSSLTLSGAIASPLATRKLTATPATLTFTGSNATFLSGKILSASPGTLVFTGSSATLNKSSKLVASPGSLTLAGSTATMFRGKVLLADPASFALTGVGAGFVRTRVLPADPGTMQFTGASATLGAPVVVQKARPGSDISAGGWLPSSGSDLYAMLDETSYNDSDYIYSPDNPTTETAEIKFTSITDPGVHTGHTLRFRLAAVGQDTVFDVYLMCGATQIATWQKTVVAGDTTTYTETLTTGEAGNITDYTDLRIKVVAHA